MSSQYNIWTDQPMNPPKDGEPGCRHEGNFDPFYTRIGHDGDLFNYLHKAFVLTKERGTRQRLLALALEYAALVEGNVFSRDLNEGINTSNFYAAWPSWKTDAVQCFGQAWAEAREIIPERRAL